MTNTIILGWIESQVDGQMFYLAYLSLSLIPMVFLWISRSHRKPQRSHADTRECCGRLLWLPQSDRCKRIFFSPFFDGGCQLSATSDSAVSYHFGCTLTWPHLLLVFRSVCLSVTFPILIYLLYLFFSSFASLLPACRKWFSPTKTTALSPSCHLLTCLRDSSR